MQRLLTMLCFTLLTTGAVRVTAQVNPYKEGTPGLTGYRSEVMAEVMVQEDSSPASPKRFRLRSTTGVQPPTCARSLRFSCT